MNISIESLIKSWSNWIDSFSIPEYSSFLGHLMLLTIALIALCGLFIICKRTYKKISNNLLPWFVVTWVSGTIIYLIGYIKVDLNGLAIVPRAIISSFKMFVISHDLARVTPHLQSDAIYMSLFSIIHFLAAFIVSIFIFRIIGYKAKCAWKINKKRAALFFKSDNYTVHLFWGINEASLLLAEDIRGKREKDTIIFIDVDKEDESNSKEKTGLSNITNSITTSSSYMERLDDINALVDHCYNGPGSVTDDKIFDSLNLRTVKAIVKYSSKCYCYFLSKNEIDNIAGALKLREESTFYSIPEETEVYIHARRNADNEVFDHYSQYKGHDIKIKIKLVDSAYLSVQTLKNMRSALPVNILDIDNKLGYVDKPFTSLIIGFGDTGQESFKFLYEYSSFINSSKEKTPFKCYVIDEKMDKIAGFIRKQMPAIDDKELNLINASIDSKEYWDQVNEIINQLNYIVITINNDTLGLSCAVNLFKYALRYRCASSPMLKIMVRCYDSSNEKRLNDVVNNLNNSISDNYSVNINIGIFGNEKEIYRYNEIVRNDIIQEAKEYNRIYNNSDEKAWILWEEKFGNKAISKLMEEKCISRYHAIYDINRQINQNVSNVLHKDTKLTLMGLIDKDGEYNKDLLQHYHNIIQTRVNESCRYDATVEEKLLLLNIARVEHERWIASMKLMGYQYGETKDLVKKYHPDICPWDTLDEMVKSYDCGVVDTSIKMIQYR